MNQKAGSREFVIPFNRHSWRIIFVERTHVAELSKLKKGLIDYKKNKFVLL